MTSVIFMGDWHVGSEVGLKPPGFKGISGNPDRRYHNGLNVVQERLWECMEDLHKEFPHPDYLVLNGDICDGTQASTPDLWTNRGEEQVMAAVECIDFLKPKKLIVTQGSMYHTGFNPSLDAYVAEKAGGQYDEEYLLVPKGSSIRFYMKHYVPVAAKKANRANGLASEMDAARRAQSEYGKIDYRICNHAHYFHSQRDSDMEGIIVPGMKGKDSFSRKGPSHYIPDLGYVAFQVGQKGAEWYPYVFNLKGSSIISVLS